MSFKLEQLPGEPIIILTFYDHITFDQVRQAFDESAAIADKTEGRLYRITDVRTAEGGFVDLLRVVGLVIKGVPGSSLDRRIHGVFVGLHQMARLYSDFMSPYAGGRSIPFYRNPDEALEYIRVRIQESKTDKQ